MIALQENQEHPRRILIIDADTEASERLKNWLERAGIEVDVAGSVLDGVFQVRDQNYELILIDCEADEDREAGMEALWLLEPTVDLEKVVIMAGKVEEPQRLKMIQKGIRHWIHKPLNQQSTLQEVESALIDVERRRRVKRRLSPFRWVRDKFRHLVAD